jgi:hypothetical protein
MVTMRQDSTTKEKGPTLASLAHQVTLATEGAEAEVEVERETEEAEALEGEVTVRVGGVVVEEGEVAVGVGEVTVGAGEVTVGAGEVTVGAELIEAAAVEVAAQKSEGGEGIQVMTRDEVEAAVQEDTNIEQTVRALALHDKTRRNETMRVCVERAVAPIVTVKAFRKPTDTQIMVVVLKLSLKRVTALLQVCY